MENKEELIRSLKPMFDDGIQAEDTDKVNAVYDAFKQDFIDNTVQIDETDLVIKSVLFSKSDEYGLPDSFKSYRETFVHIITREEKETSKKISKTIRRFDEKRANRVHWIRPIIENSDCKLVERFEFIESNGKLREYFWCRCLDYIVVVEYQNPNYKMITGFCIDGENRAYYQNKYIHRVK